MISEDDVAAILCSLHDCAMVLAPGGWNSVEFVTVERHGVLALASLETRGLGSKEPKKKPALHIEEETEVARASAALFDLQHALEGHRKPWRGGRVRCDRSATFEDWKCFSPEGALCFFFRIDGAMFERLIITEDLSVALLGTERAFESLQRTFESVVGASLEQRYSPDDGVVRILSASGNLQWPAELVGSYDSRSFVWQWGWASRQPLFSQRTKGICLPEQKPAGFSALWRPELHCDEGFAWALAAHITVGIGAQGLMRAPLSPHQVAFVAPMRLGAG